MSGILFHIPELGLYASTLLCTVNPSLPPTAYRTPSKTPTPKSQRRTHISATGVHLSRLG